MKGEPLFRGRRGVRGILVPRIPVDQQDNVTAAKVVLDRSQLQASPSDLIRPFQPRRSSAAQVLQASGLLDSTTTEFQMSTSLPEDAQGIFNDLDSIGVTVARFLDEVACNRVIEELAEDYTFVEDFDLALPSPIVAAGDDDEHILFSDAPDDDEWREESGIAKAHANGIKGRGAIVGVLDTGIDIDHDNFRNGNRPNKNVPFVNVPLLRPDNVRKVRGFDTDGHGTHVCGIIRGRNTGIAPQADLCVASVLESETTRTSFIRVIVGLQWLMKVFQSPTNRDRPAIVNLSLGFPPVCPPNMEQEHYEQSEAMLKTIVDSLHRANILLVAAIGNDGEGLYRVPGAYENVLAVGAVDYSHQVARFSSCEGATGKKPDVVGFGVNVLSSWNRTQTNDSTYKRLSGTSMAAPYISGLAALYWSRDRSLTSQDLRSQLLSSALRLDEPKAYRYGHGLGQFNL
jgi:subtilisin family serine protease